MKNTNFSNLFKSRKLIIVVSTKLYTPVKQFLGNEFDVIDAGAFLDNNQPKKSGVSHNSFLHVKNKRSKRR